MAVSTRNKPAVKTVPKKVLLFDVESSPNIGYTWGKWEQNVIEFVKEKQIISFAWKWLDEKEVHCLALPMFKGYLKDRDSNKALIERLHELFCRADVIIAHNIVNFDDKMANTDFLLNGLPPPPPHKTVDTLRVARSKFAFSSNKLDDLGARLGLGRKVKHPGFPMWLGCMNGDKKSWAEMVKYNKGDVILLEKIYLALRPYMTNHPNMNAMDDHLGCPACKSTNMQRRGFTMSGAGRRSRFQCMDCGKWSAGSKKTQEKYR